MKAALLAVFCAFSLILQGSLFDSPQVVMDTESERVYRQVSADRLLTAFAEDESAAKELYGGQNLLLVGKITSKGNGKLTVGGISKSFEQKVSCKAEDEALYEEINTFHMSDVVRIYGRFSVGFLNGELNISADRLEKAGSGSDSDLTGTIYSTIDGVSLDTSKAPKRSLAGGAVSFRIPDGWKAVEHDLKAEGLGRAEGYQYRLNESGQKAAYAESFFIIALDKKELVDINDRDDARLIEKAVAADILGKSELSKKYPLKTVRTSYGPTYRYYRDNFEKSGGDRLNAEFIFKEAGEDLLVVCLYVYREPNRLGEVMLTLRGLEG